MSRLTSKKHLCNCLGINEEAALLVSQSRRQEIALETRDKKEREARNAFTLVELLTVIVIISILGALAIPAWMNMIERSDEMKCASNLRQIGVATQLYVMDHDGNYPPISPNGAVPDSTYWYMALAPYINPNINPNAQFTRGGVLSVIESYRCPTVLSKRKGLAKDSIERWYGINYLLGPSAYTTHWVKAVSVSKPSETIYMTETWGGNQADPYWIQYLAKQYFGGKGVHNGRNNVLFCDGHVEPLTLDSLLGPERQRWWQP